MQLLLTRSGIVPWARASEVTRGLYLGACFPSGCFQSMSRHMHAQHWPRGIECTACRTPAPHAHQQCCSSGVMWRECAADMEGGAPEEDLSDVLPPFGPQHANSHHAEGDDGDDSLFWDYVGPKAGPGSSNSSNAAAPPPAPAPSSAPWSSIMATAKSAMAGAPSAAQKNRAPIVKHKYNNWSPVILP
eukprot:scaffold200191_cov22-Tisochrysis_lutea.AAC.3